MTYRDLIDTLEEEKKTIVRVYSHNCCGKGLGRNGVCYCADTEVTIDGKSSGYQISRETFNRLAKEGYPVTIGWGFGEGKFPNALAFYGESEDARCKRYLGTFVYNQWKNGTLKVWKED